MKQSFKSFKKHPYVQRYCIWLQQKLSAVKKKNQTNTQPKGECQILYRFKKKKKTFRAFQHYPLEIPSVNHFISEKAFY